MTGDRCPHGFLPPCRICDHLMDAAATNPPLGPIYCGSFKLTPDGQLGEIVDPPWSFESSPCQSFSGFDTSSQRDKTATIKTVVKPLDYAFEIDEVELMGVASREHAERIAEHIRGMRAWPRWETAGDPRPRPEHWNCRSTMNPQYGDGSGRYEAEVNAETGHRLDRYTQRCTACGTSQVAIAEGLSPRCGFEVIVQGSRGLSARPVGASL